MEFMGIIIRLRDAMLGSPLFWVWLILMLSDITFGVIRAVRDKKSNSAIGINALTRKAGMAAAIFFLELLDLVLAFNLINLLPDTWQQTLVKVNIVKLGVADYFALHYAFMEALSNCKNMIIVGLPLPHAVVKFLAAWMDENTDETNVDLSALLASRKETAAGEVKQTE